MLRRRSFAYTSTETHNSVAKAFGTLGLGTENLRRIPRDSDFRLRLDALSAAVAEDRHRGKAPFCVIANAGTVATGAIDPIAELSRFCADQHLWLHVDGAYGALGVLSQRFRKELTALGLADSLSLDPHKLLFTSFEAGCLLVRDAASLRRSFSSAPSYLNMERDSDLINYADYGPQLSRGFKALKVWWSLRPLRPSGLRRRYRSNARSRTAHEFDCRSTTRIRAHGPNRLQLRVLPRRGAGRQR